MPAKRPDPTIPQVLSIVNVSKRGTFALKKAVRRFLGDPTHICWELGAEVSLAPCSPSAPDANIAARRLTLPARAADRLDGEPFPDYIALVERSRRVGVKRFELALEDSDAAQVVDKEERVRLRRVVYTNPPPECVLAELVDWAQNKRLRTSLRKGLKGQRTLEAWEARSLLGWTTRADAALRSQLATDRQSRQLDDGSWDHDVSQTARALVELSALEVTSDATTQRGMAWLLSRPESHHNPGMVFGYDDLVAQQVEVVAQRRVGHGARFRERRAKEMRASRTFDELYNKPCGPRIMWPNAHVLQAALALGCEEHPRIQRMLDTLATQDWCECGYQHGTSGWRRTEPMDDQVITAFEVSCRQAYRLGGISDLETLYRMDLSWTLGQPLLRIATLDGGGSSRYRLSRYDHLQGCELVTTRALARIQAPALQRLAVAHLWRFAGRQDPESGAFGGGSLAGYFHTPLAVLDTVSRYHVPIALAILARSLPGIIDQQRDDGLWGEGVWAPALTLVVARTLARLAPYLPDEFVY